MRNPNLVNMDLNLLVPLHALLVERSVTKAGERLSVGQPTMSTALAKLRRVFDDPLLLKDGRGWVLSPLADSLVEQLEDVLSRIGYLLGGTASFDPASARRTFTVVADDYSAVLMMGPLWEEVADLAPQVRINLISHQAGSLDMLRQKKCDLVLRHQAAVSDDDSAFPSAVLLSDDFVGVVAEDHPDVGGRLFAEHLSRLPYVRVSGSAMALAETHLVKNIRPGPGNAVATTETLTSALHMLSGTRMFTITQRRMFDRFGRALGLRAAEIEMPATAVSEVMYWHPQSSADPAQQWLRSTILGIAAGLSGTARPRAAAA
ncbi:LysR substrate-binding domain-containing protein [Streptomyces sp. NPDC007983]|uniref:LysR family transcriptional regulator n=1 Tax=Streptomyces sp. NPDC007983 TaxID=3364800 RepID=UPI0036E83FF8